MLPTPYRLHRVSVRTNNLVHGTRRSLRLCCTSALILGLISFFTPAVITAQDGCRIFSETGKTVCGRFLEYWDQNGALPQQGYPITNELQEVSDTDGKAYTIQYFERAVFEWHPENQPPYDVLLSLLGRFQYDRKNYKQTSTDCTDLHRRTGVIIGQGTNTVPTGLDKLKTYRVEEVVLPGFITCTVWVPHPTNNDKLQQQTVTVDRVWRLTVTREGRFAGGKQWTIWLDHKVIGTGVRSVDLSELTTVVYDRALLREGASIAVDGATSYLPEKLYFNNVP